MTLRRSRAIGSVFMFALAFFALGCGDDASTGVISEVSSDTTDATGNAIPWGEDGNVGFPDVNSPDGGEGAETDANPEGTEIQSLKHNQHKQLDRPSAGRCSRRYVP